MNDFLGQLASRALAPQQTLKPRLLSAFEPANPALGPLLVGLDPRDMTGPAPAAAVVQESHVVKSMPDPPAVRPAESIPQRPVRRISEERVQSTTEPRVRLPTPPPASADQALSPLQPLPGRRRDESSSVQPRPAFERETRSDHDALRSPSAAQLSRAPHLETNPQLSPARKDSSLQPRTNGRAEDPARPALPALASLLAGLRPKLTPPPSRPEPLLRAEAPCTIHVTIGRLEVRAAATPTPTPPAKRARPGPALGLKEYLERRKGGPAR